MASSQPLNTIENTRFAFYWLLAAGREPQLPVKRIISQKYDGQVLQALLFVWHTANQICSKRQG
jgi:hypothetical protein